MKKFILFFVPVILITLIFGLTSLPLHAQQPAKKEVKLITATFGSTAYLVAQQLATEVNRTHPWLRITVIEGKPNNVHELANKPEIRKNTVVESATFTNWLVQQGKRPAKAPYHGGKGLCSFAGLMAVPIFTLDKDIKTLEDLKGKRVNLFVKGTQGETTMTALLKHLGIFDTIKRDYLAFKPSVDAIIDGTVDAIVGYATLVQEEPKKFNPVPAYLSMLQARKTYIIDIPSELQRKLSKATGMPVTPIKVPAGSLPTGVPERDITTFSTYIWWFADETFPDELAYELVKVFAQHIGALKKTSPAAQALSIEKLATSDLKPDEYHPGALRFFKEKGIKVVTE